MTKIPNALKNQKIKKRALKNFSASITSHALDGGGNFQKLIDLYNYLDKIEVKSK